MYLLPLVWLVLYPLLFLGSCFIIVFVQKPSYSLAIKVATLIYLDVCPRSAFILTKTHTFREALFLMSHRAGSIDWKRFSGNALIELKEGTTSPPHCSIWRTVLFQWQHFNVTKKTSQNRKSLIHLCWMLLEIALSSLHMYEEIWLCMMPFHELKKPSECWNREHE